MAEAPRRAKAMSVEDRRAMLIDATIPLLIAHGRGVTTRQIAEAAGVAEGTIFRAFEDKNSLVTAAIRHHLDPEPLRRALREIDPADGLEATVRRVLALLRERFSGVIRLMAVVAEEGRPKPPPVPERLEYAGIVADALRGEAARLNIPAERVASFIRLVAFASSIPVFAGTDPFSEDELGALVLYGLAGTRPSDPA